MLQVSTNSFEITQVEKEYFIQLPALPTVLSVAFDSHGDPESFNSADGIRFVPVAVGELAGYYAVGLHKVFCPSRRQVFTPTGFESAGGKSNNRKWRVSLRLLMPGGRKGMCFGKWLVANSLQHLVPEAPTPLRRTRPGEGSSSPPPDSSPRNELSSPVFPSPGKRSPAAMDPTLGSPTKMPRFMSPPSLDSLSFRAALRGEVPTLSAADLAALRMPNRGASAPRSLGPAFSAATSRTGSPSKRGPVGPVINACFIDALVLQLMQQMQGAGEAPAGGETQLHGDLRPPVDDEALLAALLGVQQEATAEAAAGSTPVQASFNRPGRLLDSQLADAIAAYGAPKPIGEAAYKAQTEHPAGVHSP